jgi:putative endonuclease
MHSYFVYILFSQRNGTLYIGVTNDIARRIHEHKNKSLPGFTKKYTVDKLAYVEEYQDISDATKREKELKKYNRGKKIYLIERSNPQWKDLYHYML